MFMKILKYTKLLHSIIGKEIWTKAKAISHKISHMKFLQKQDWKNLFQSRTKKIHKKNKKKIIPINPNIRIFSACGYCAFCWLGFMLLTFLSHQVHWYVNRNFFFSCSFIFLLLFRASSENFLNNTFYLNPMRGIWYKTDWWILYGK